MSMTVKQLADSLGVSKTAVRKRFTDEFRANHTQTTANGVLEIDDKGCKLIAETMQTTANRTPETTENIVKTIPETHENTANELLETLKQTIETLKQQNTVLTEQLSVKDTQIASYQEQVKTLTNSLQDTTAALTAAQALHAGTIKGQLIEQSERSDSKSEEVAIVEEQPKHWWQKLFRKK